jgi:hypothetical protein
MNFKIKYQKYIYKLFGGSEIKIELLAYTHNSNFQGLDINNISDDLALSNGNFLYNYLKLYLNNDSIVKTKSIQVLLPHDTIIQDRIDKILYFFSTDDNKKWLSRQMYLVNNYSGIIDDTYVALQDDVLLFFNWLTNREGYKAPMISETHLKI